MSGNLPVVMVVIAVILVAIALFAIVYLIRNKGKLEQLSIRNNKAFFAQWIAGLILALTAAFFMFDGEILGENTAGIATVIGIVGIGLIATSNVTLIALKRK